MYVSDEVVMERPLVITLYWAHLSDLYPIHSKIRTERRSDGDQIAGRKLAPEGSDRSLQKQGMKGRSTFHQGGGYTGILRQHYT